MPRTSRVPCSPSTVVWAWDTRLSATRRPHVSQDLFERFTKCAVSLLAVDAAKVTREARFKEDLEADSLDLVEFVMELESEFGVEVPEKELEGITTVGQAFDLIVAKTK
ncbi:MAG: acyl carrier protein [Actinomycetota bacterium]